MIFIQTTVTVNMQFNFQVHFILLYTGLTYTRVRENTNRVEDELWKVQI